MPPKINKTATKKAKKHRKSTRIRKKTYAIYIYKVFYQDNVLTSTLLVKMSLAKHRTPDHLYFAPDLPSNIG